MTNPDIIRAHYAASDRGDLAGMVADFADDVAWTEAAGFPLAGTYIGPQAVIDNVFTKLGEDWEGYTVTIDEVIDGGDTVVGLGAYSGTHRASGKPFVARVAHVWRLAGGKVAAFEQFTDTLLVARASGEY